MEKQDRTLARKDASRDGGVTCPTLFLVNSLCMGGSEKKIVAISNALVRHGHQVHIAYLGGAETLRPRIDPAIPAVHLGRSGKLSPGALWRLCLYVRDNRITRIAAVNLYPLLYAFLASRMLRPRRTCIALVNTTDHRSRRDQAFMLLYAPLLRRSDQVIFGSLGQEKAWISSYRLPPARCRTILNGVDTDYYSLEKVMTNPVAARVTSLIPPGRFVIGSVGALRPEKAHEDILRAAGVLLRRGVPVSVVLVGEGPRASYLKQVAAEEGMADSVVFSGLTDDVRPLLAMMDVFVLSSVAVETFSNAALEAMACSRCVVLSDVGGAREMIVNGESGFLYTPGTVSELAEVLGTLYQNETLRESVAAAARRRALDLFSFRVMLEAYRKYVLNGLNDDFTGCSHTG